MANSSMAAQLLEITDDTPDTVVARMIADAATEREPERYRFSINHDTRGPKFAACPLVYDWQRKDHVGIETGLRSTARHWLECAAHAGYTISEVDRNNHDIGSLYSIALVRQRAAYHQRPKLTLGDDDDIPF